MIKMTFFKKREPKRYDYYPRYYDADKEDLEKRIKNAKAEMGIQSDEDGEDVRREITFRKQAAANWGDSSYSRQARIANLRLILILGGIGVLFFFIYSKVDFLIAKFAG